MFCPDTSLIGQTETSTRRFQVVFAQHRSPHYTESDVCTVIVPAYVAACARAGLRAELVLAQLVHETGWLSSWWSMRPRRNPAGLGVTGRQARMKPDAGVWQWKADARAWCEGLAFETWANDAIPAHVGRLLAYALPVGAGDAHQQAMVAHALALRPLPARYRGVAPTVAGLGGTWAVPGHDYAQKLAAIANDLRG